MWLRITKWLPMQGSYEGYYFHLKADFSKEIAAFERDGISWEVRDEFGGCYSYEYGEDFPKDKKLALFRWVSLMDFMKWHPQVNVDKIIEANYY